MPDHEFCVVVTTVADEAAARCLADVILENRLAACVQWHAIASAYRWQGAVQNDREVLVQSKTTRSAAARLQAFIRERHAYETPEIIVLPVVGGLPEYFGWISEETR